ncbi:MAG: hypothetical protein ABSF90_15985 [Syntrophobacteraceae bacterium]
MTKLPAMAKTVPLTIPDFIVSRVFPVSFIQGFKNSRGDHHKKTTITHAKAATNTAGKFI